MNEEALKCRCANSSRSWACTSQQEIENAIRTAAWPTGADSGSGKIEAFSIERTIGCHLTSRRGIEPRTRPQGIGIGAIEARASFRDRRCELATLGA